MNTPWIKRTLVGVAACAALAGSLAAWSQGEHGRPHGGPPSAEDIAGHQARMLEMIGRSLDLDTTQKARLQTLADQLHAQHDALLKGGTDPRERMKALIAGNTFDRAGAQALVNEKVAQIKTSSPALITAAGDFFDSLTAAQQQKVRDFAAEHRGPPPMDRRGPPPASN